jgi:hypothetical protein
MPDCSTSWRPPSRLSELIEPLGQAMLASFHSGGAAMAMPIRSPSAEAPAAGVLLVPRIRQGPRTESLAPDQKRRNVQHGISHQSPVYLAPGADVTLAMFGAAVGSALRTSKLIGMANATCAGSVRNFTYADARIGAKPRVTLDPHSSKTQARSIESGHYLTRVSPNGVSQLKGPLFEGSPD